MARAAKPCHFARCPELQPCPNPEHQKVAWSGSKRAEKTMSGSKQQARSRRILRDPANCDADGFPICHVCGLPGANEADHVIPLAECGSDDDSNVKPIHDRPCHKEKTASEATRARQRAATPGG